jgi:hypothetical protein
MTIEEDTLQKYSNVTVEELQRNIVSRSTGLMSTQSALTQLRKVRLRVAAAEIG